jgi:hypothetical protein
MNAHVNIKEDVVWFIRIRFKQRQGTVTTKLLTAFNGFIERFHRIDKQITVILIIVDYQNLLYHNMQLT